MPSHEDVVVFIDTNLSTSIAVAVNPDTRMEDFKRELEKTHLGCFPDIGKIRVYGVTVKRKSCLYHLPDSIPIKYVFHGLVGSWFLQAEVTVLNGSVKPDFSKTVATEVVEDHVYNGSSLTDYPVMRNERNTELRSSGNGRWIKESRKIEHLQREIPEASSVCAAKSSKKRKIDAPSETLGFMSPTDSKVLARRCKAKRHRVGKRILTASNKIKTSVNKRRHAMSFCGTINKKLARPPNSTCPIRYLVFEISDSDD